MPTTIDDALTLLRDTGPEYSRGLSNHGPMLAETLIALDCSELVIPWLDKYKRQLSSMPSKSLCISESNYLSALGDISRFRDWQIFFQEEMKQKPWRDLLNEWVDRLSPGYIAAAMHGVIRTGHAVRSLTNGESEERIAELASGLAYWAARYQRLPETKSKRTAINRSVYEVLNTIDLLPGVQREKLGLITNEIATLENLASFSEVINLIDQSDKPEESLTRLTEGFAFMFLRNAEPTREVIALVHALTGPYALRQMLPYLKAPVAKKALKYAWQASAALYVRYGLGMQPIVEEFAPSFSRSELVERAVATGDEHAVKYVEACIAEHESNPNPVYLSSAEICCRLLL